MKSEDSDDGDGDDDAQEHDRDENGGSICCFWGGLGDTKGVDEHIREIKERLHCFLRKAESSVPGPHLLLKYAFCVRIVCLPPCWQETTLIK